MADTPTPEPRYLVTARKYRPQTFGDLVAQEHVAETLRNAILRDRLAHAYLFSGPRGVGKTTAARLLAKAVNCKTPLSERPDAEPCRTCDACRAFEEGRALNVIEIDAASNNKVEDIRELRETVRIPPQGAAKKVYILDEVHMLSASAFNALLKTLEEPPPYALFIFATTEPHKVLPTILSRTQRFDFRRIQVPEIVGRLRGVCANEGIEADEGSLVLIARKGDGALRDALSLFDQAVSLCGTALRVGALREALGVVDEDVFFAVTDRAADSDRAGLVALVDGLVRRGLDLAEFVDGLAEHLRNLLVTRSMGRADLVEGTEATQGRYAEAARSWSEADLLHLLMIADRCASGLRGSRQPRLTVELAVLQMASLARVTDLDRLLAKLERLEAAVASGSLPAAPARPATPEATPAAPEAAAPPAPTAPSPSAAPAASQTAEAPAAYAPAPAVPTPAAPEPAAPEPAAPEPAAPAAPQPADSGPASPEPRPADDAPPHDGPSHDRSPRDDGEPPSEPPAPRPPAPAAPPSASPRPAPSLESSLFGAPAIQKKTDRGPSGDGASAEAAFAGGAPVVAQPADPHFGISLPTVQAAWPQVVAHLRDHAQHRLSSLLTDTQPVGVRRGAVEVAVPNPMSCELLGNAMETVTAALAAVSDGDTVPPLRFVLAEAPAQAETAPAADPFERLKQLRQENPVVRALFERFGAEIVWT